MDIVLEGEPDGIETTKFINNNFNIPVIFLTAYSGKKTLQTHPGGKSSGYILKPVHEKRIERNGCYGLAPFRIGDKTKGKPGTLT